MGKVLIGLLLAGAAAPALAAGGPHDRHHNDDNNNSAPRQEVRAERPSRGGGNDARPQVDRSMRAERPQFAGRPQFTGQRPQLSGDVQRVRPVMRENPYAQQAPDSVRNWRPQEQAVQARESFQQRRVDTDRDPQRRYSGSYGVRQPYANNGTRQDSNRYAGHRDGGSHSHWNTNWRNDHRYDWRDRRRHNSSLFHIGLYIDPFGWNYQPYSVGYRLYPNYYQQNYWIDPGMYGLPYPPQGMEWIRYYNDALLIDIYSGEVVDSIQGFFW